MESEKRVPEAELTSYSIIKAKDQKTESTITDQIDAYIKFRRAHSSHEVVAILNFFKVDTPTISFARDLMLKLLNDLGENCVLLHLYGVLSQHRNWYLLKDRTDDVHHPCKTGLLFQTIVKFILTNDKKGEMFKRFLQKTDSVPDGRFFSGTAFSTAVGEELEEPILKTMKYFFELEPSSKYKIDLSQQSQFWQKKFPLVSDTVHTPQSLQ